MDNDHYFNDIVYFEFGEFLRSTTAVEKGFDEQFDPPENVVVSLHSLAENVLDPARSALGKAVKITSGYRCERLNAAVGSTDSSHHVKGMAADLKCGDLDGLFYILSGMEFTQLIRYYEDEAKDAPVKKLKFLHVSYDPENLKCEIKERYVENGIKHYVKWV